MAELRKTLGLPSLLFYSVGVIVGAGVYSVIGAAAGEAGYNLWVSFALGALVALFTALSYAELATTFPKAGAEYIYIQEALPTRKWLPFLIGFVLTAAAAATATTVSLAFGGYFEMFTGWRPWMSGAALLVFCTAVNIIGIRESSWLNIVFTSIEVLGLLVVVYFGITSDSFADRALPIVEPGILSGAALIFFVYLGFEEIANLAEESKDPGKHLPKAIYISLVVTTVLYILVALAVLSLATPELLSSSSAPLSDAIRKISAKAATGLAIVALFSTANTALITLLSASRMLFSMAREGSAPRIFGLMIESRKSPWSAAVVVLVIAAALLPFGSVAVTASISSFGSLIAFAAVNLSLIALALRRPELKRPFRAPGRIGRVPLTGVLGLASIGLLISQFDSVTYLVGAIVTGIGILAYVHHTRASKRREELPQG